MNPRSHGAFAGCPVRILPLAKGATRQDALNSQTSRPVPFPLHDIASSRRIETARAAVLPPHTLMQRAGLSVARLALALQPHAHSIWIAAGPGNNGGDGLEAAAHLRRWGKTVHLSWLGSPERSSADTLAAYHRARQAGVAISNGAPVHFDLAIDALLGIGASTGGRQIDGKMAEWAARMNVRDAPVLAIDLPSGLNADTGAAVTHSVQATATLSLVTLKPGLFMAQGRDHCGDIWFDALGCDADLSAQPAPTAQLANPPPAAYAHAAHQSHKGSFGDVAVIGGATGMTGAALLAASAALHAGAGRVLVGLLDGGSVAVDPAQPELMFRPADALDLRRALVVCGCGGGNAIRAFLPKLLSTAPCTVLDADALNAIAQDADLQTLLIRRSARGRPSVLTPHPLEAARLLGTSTADVQANRLDAARQLAQRFACIVVLKGSGTVVAAPGLTPSINPTGNALLATAGTGDVLAGMIGAALARCGGTKPAAVDMAAAFKATIAAVYRHGQIADAWQVDQGPADQALTASALASKA